MANKHTTLTPLFDDIADAIRSTSSITGEIPADAFPAYILAKGRSDCPATPGVLNSCPWSFIKWASGEGLADLFWSVGDRKAVTLGTWGATGDYAVAAGTYYCYILGFNHNSAKEGNNRIHFEFGFDSLSGGNHIAFCGSDYGLAWSNSNPYYIRMNSSKTNAGGWASSLMRTGTLNGTNRSFATAVPSDLKAVLKTVTKYTDNVGGGSGNVASNITATTDTFFLLSSQELRGAGLQNSYEANSTAQYQYYKNGNEKGRKKSNDTGVTCNAILRSCSPSSNQIFAGYAADAGVNIPASTTSAVSPCFCV